VICVLDIQRVVAEAYGISVADIKEPDGVGARLPTKVRPRQVAMFLARTHIMSRTYGDGTRPISFNLIGRHFGNRDHSTVFHAVNSIARERLKSKKLNTVLGSMERKMLAVDNLRESAFFTVGESA
jgi:chromosomal replication initiation ATPase DnaA